MTVIKRWGDMVIKNMNGKPLQLCSKNPLTGYYRNGYCETGFDDKEPILFVQKWIQNF